MYYKNRRPRRIRNKTSTMDKYVKVKKKADIRPLETFVAQGINY